MLCLEEVIDGLVITHHDPGAEEMHAEHSGFVVVHQFTVIVETFHLEADHRSARGEWTGCLTTGNVGESLRHPR